MNRRGFFGALAGGIAALTGHVPARPGRYATVRMSALAGLTDTLLARLDQTARGIWSLEPLRAPTGSVAAVAGGRVEQIAQHLTGELGKGLQCVDGGFSIDVAASSVSSGHEVAFSVGHHHTDRVVSGPSRLGKGPAPEHVDEKFLQGRDATPQLSPFGPDLHVLPSCALPLTADVVVVWDRRAVDEQLSNAPPADHSTLIDSTASLPPVVQMRRLLDLFGSSADTGPAFVEALIGELVLTRVRLAAADPRVLCSFDPVAA